MNYKTIAEINKYTGQTVNPLNHPNDMYELYSVPSFDEKHPEIVRGRDIGSAKVSVLCKKEMF